MSLSVERLKELYARINWDCEARECIQIDNINGEYREVDDDDIKAALSELLAIKEAEPVRWLYQLDGVPHDTVVRNKIPASDGMRVHALIIKPE